MSSWIAAATVPGTIASRQRAGWPASASGVAHACGAVHASCQPECRKTVLCIAALQERHADVPLRAHRVEGRVLEGLAARHGARELELERLRPLRYLPECGARDFETRHAVLAEPTQVRLRELEARAELPQRREGIFVEVAEIRGEEAFEVGREALAEARERIVALHAQQLAAHRGE